MTDPTSINVAIAEALGLDPRRIAKGGVTITLDGNLGPVVTVEYHKPDVDLGLMWSAVKRYKLVPLD